MASTICITQIQTHRKVEALPSCLFAALEFGGRCVRNRCETHGGAGCLAFSGVYSCKNSYPIPWSFQGGLALSHPKRFAMTAVAKGGDATENPGLGAKK
jgi:hypothetical protein